MFKNINLPGKVEICTLKGAVVKTLEVQYDRGVTMWGIIQDGVFWAISPIRFVTLIKEAQSGGYVIRDNR